MWCAQIKNKQFFYKYEDKMDTYIVSDEEHHGILLTYNCEDACWCSLE
jgi:hypothetical protein